MSEIYYFGCVGRIGHHLHKPSEHGSAQSHESRKMAWTKICDGGLGLEDIDGGQNEGCGIWAYIRGYSIVSFWDRTVDDRRGSTSSFLLKGLHAFTTVLAVAEGFFPNIFRRYTFKPIPVLIADVADDIGFISAVESFRVILATTRAANGRDYIRGQKYGKLLDALDAGAEKLLGTDMWPQGTSGKAWSTGTGETVGVAEKSAGENVFNMQLDVKVRCLDCKVAINTVDFDMVCDCDNVRTQRIKHPFTAEESAKVTVSDPKCAEVHRDDTWVPFLDVIHLANKGGSDAT